MARFEEVARLAPAEGLDEASAKANYSLGVVMATSGRTNEAIQRLSAAVKYNPNYVEALMALGDTLRRIGSDRGLAEAVRGSRAHQPARCRRAIRLRDGAGAAAPLSRRAGLAGESDARAAGSPRALPRAGPRCWPRRQTTACATARGRWLLSRSCDRHQDDGVGETMAMAHGGTRSVRATPSTSSAACMAAARQAGLDAKSAG